MKYTNEALQFLKEIYFVNYAGLRKEIYRLLPDASNMQVTEISFETLIEFITADKTFATPENITNLLSQMVVKRCKCVTVEKQPFLSDMLDVMFHSAQEEETYTDFTELLHDQSIYQLKLKQVTHLLCVQQLPVAKAAIIATLTHAKVVDYHTHAKKFFSMLVQGLAKSKHCEGIDFG